MNAATGASLVLFCHNARRNLLAGNLPPDTLWDQLARNNPPPRLREVATTTDGSFTLDRVTASRCRAQENCSPVSPTGSQEWSRYHHMQWQRRTEANRVA